MSEAYDIYDPDVVWGVFEECRPLKDERGAYIDCDPRLSGSPYTRDELRALMGQNRVWTTMVGEEDDELHIAPAAHVVNALAWYVTELPAPQELLDCY